MPRPPQNLHVVTISRSRDNAIRKKSAVPAMRHDNGGLQIAAPATKTATHLQKMTQNDFRHAMKHVGMSQSATPATRNEATRRWKPPKVTPFAELAIGTAIKASCDRPRMVADGSERKRNVERTYPQPPDPQSETGTLATHSGKNKTTILKKQKAQKNEYTPGCANGSQLGTP